MEEMILKVDSEIIMHGEKFKVDEMRSSDEGQTWQTYYKGVKL